MNINKNISLYAQPKAVYELQISPVSIFLICGSSGQLEQQKLHEILSFYKDAQIATAVFCVLDVINAASAQNQFENLNSHSSVKVLPIYAHNNANATVPPNELVQISDIPNRIIIHYVHEAQITENNEWRELKVNVTETLSDLQYDTKSCPLNIILSNLEISKAEEIDALEPIILKSQIIEPVDDHTYGIIRNLIPARNDCFVYSPQKGQNKTSSALVKLYYKTENQALREQLDNTTQAFKKVSMQLGELKQRIILEEVAKSKSEATTTHQAKKQPKRHKYFTKSYWKKRYKKLHKRTDKLHNFIGNFWIKNRMS